MELLGYFTEKGAALSAKLLTGTALTITRVAAGDGETALSAAALERECQTLAVSAMRRSGATVVLPATLMAALAEEDYTLREIGVYARDPEEGEILYRLYHLNPAAPIAAGGSLVLRLELAETVSETAQVTVEGTAVGLLTQADLDALRGVPEGLATLNENGIVPPGQLPAMDFAPAVHAGQHASGGADPITPESIGAAASGHSHAWSEVTGKPSAFTPEAHTHDDRYYTEAEVNSLMAGKQDASSAINTGNIASQSVNYANSANYANGAGNADTVDGWHMNLDPGGWGIKPICAGTGDMAAGATALADGHIYLVYE